MAVVRAHVQAPVSQYDDQSAPGMYDLKIEYVDARVGAVEVTAAEDQDFTARQGALAGHRALLEDARLERDWLVILSDNAVVNAARLRLPQLLLRLERVGMDEASIFNAGDTEPDNEMAGLYEQLKEAQVQTARAIRGPGGTVVITAPIRTAFLSQDPDDVVTFVEEFAQARPSDVAKLGRADAAERHLSVWGGVFSTGWIPLRALELDVPELPVRAPRLPDEITHIWVAPEATPPARIVVWSATTGWLQAGTVRPAGPALNQSDLRVHRSGTASSLLSRVASC